MKNSWKCSGFGLFSCWQLSFHEKNCQKNFGRKTRENVWVLSIEFLDKSLTFRIVWFWRVKCHSLALLTRLLFLVPVVFEALWLEWCWWPSSFCFTWPRKSFSFKVMTTVIVFLKMFFKKLRRKSLSCWRRRQFLGGIFLETSHDWVSPQSSAGV